MIAEFRKKLAESPEYARCAPFLIFVVITVLGGYLPGDWKFWMYTGKTILGAWFVWEMRRYVAEMRWKLSWEAVVVGVLVFVMWVGIDPFYPKISAFFKDTEESIWNPFARFGEGSMLAWTLIVIRILGMTFVVPPLEEVFFRSFLYRYVIRYDFQSVALTKFDGVALTLTVLLFASEHFQWLAGILCGLAYQLLVLRKGRIGDAMTAHAITNLMLGVYVVWKSSTDPSAWKFF